MEIITSYKGTKLIKKYNQYYIRFMGGQYSDEPCDILISDNEAMSIVSNNEKIKRIRDEYKKRIPWTLEHFMDVAISDYMMNECNMSEKRITKGIEKLNRHTDVKLELYETLMYDSFPEKAAISVCGYTAKSLKDSTQLSILGVYNYLIYLRENPNQALADLKAGLPRR